MAPRPTPEPRYSNPANSHGLVPLPSNSLASGVLPPNSAAEARARGTPGHARPSCRIVAHDFIRVVWRTTIGPQFAVAKTNVRFPPKADFRSRAVDPKIEVPNWKPRGHCCLGLRTPGHDATGVVFNPCP